jgi:hypothetical protein
MVIATLLLFMLALPQAVSFGSLPRFTLGILTIPIVIALAIRRVPVLAAIVVVFTVLQYLWVLNVWSGRLGVAP